MIPRQMQTLATCLVVAALSAVIAGCDGGSDASSTTDGSVSATVPPTATNSTSSPAATTTTATTSPSTSTPSSSVPTATSQPVDSAVEAKAEVARDGLFAWTHLIDLELNPSLEGLDKELGRAAVPGSDVFRDFRRIIVDAVRNDERLVLGKPRVRELTLENVELVGRPPYRQAFLTACDVLNANWMRVAPDGTLTPSGPQASFPHAQRWRFPLRLHDGEWKLHSLPPRASVGGWEALTCGE